MGGVHLQRRHLHHPPVRKQPPPEARTGEDPRGKHQKECPPLPNQVTDAAILASLAGTTLLVLRAGAHPVREILMSVKRLAQNGVRVRGAVFNDVSGAGARYSKYSYQYRYETRA